MALDIPNSLAIAGLLIAVALGLPSILAHWREKRSKDSIDKVLEELMKLREQVEEMRRHAVLAARCIEKSNLSISVQRSVFSELIQNEDANWDVADQIFNEQDQLARRAFLHLQLESSSLDDRHTAAHILATEMGNAESIIHMEESTSLLDDVDKKLIKNKTLQLVDRLR